MQIRFHLFTEEPGLPLRHVCLYVECAPLKEALVVGQSLVWLTCCQTHPCIACEEERHVRDICVRMVRVACVDSAAEGHLQSIPATQTPL